MQGHIKRKLRSQAAEARAARLPQPDHPCCAFCQRPLGSRIEWHHLVPKSQGGTETVPLHPICHRAIHAHLSNHDLARHFADLDNLRAHEDIQRFLRWIRDKPANFHAPTRRKHAD